MTARPSTLPSFTPRERDVLRLIGDDLSNAEIAERLVVSPQTVRWYVKEIYSKLGVHSRDEALALLDSLEEETEPASPLASHNLPALVTSLVGRTYEIAALRALLRDPAVRLLTLLGPPGIGKTRLSIETAHRLITEFPNGVFFVALAPLSDPALVGDAILSALDLDASGTTPAAGRLRVYLRNKRLLLVLDNFEHVLPAAPLIGDLLTAAPGVKVLATSREPLRVYGEREFIVPPLDPASEAPALFEARAQAVRPDFAVDDQNGVTVTAICQKLDGLPLAIELAAARMKLFTAHALLGRLSHRLSFLTGGARNLPERQRTLRAAIDWSYDLLTPDEQRLFARFAVFEGGASLEAFAEICGFGLTLDPFDGLESLVGKSLIQQVTGADGEPRFVMLEMLREFAAGKLAESGEEAALQEIYARTYLTLAAAYARSLHTANEAWGFQGLDTEQVNIRAAWLFAAAQPSDSLIGLAAAYWWQAFYYSDHMADGMRLYEVALQPRVNDDTIVAAHLMNGRAVLGLLLGEFSANLSLAQRALALAEKHDDALAQINALRNLSADAYDVRGDKAERIRLDQQALEIARREHFTVWEDRLRHRLAAAEYSPNHYQPVMEELQRQLQSVQKRGIRSLAAVIYSSLMEGCMYAGDLDRAQACIEASLAATQSLPMHRFTAAYQDDLALLTFLRGEYTRARGLVAHSLESHRMIGIPDYVLADLVTLAAIEAQCGENANAYQYLTEAVGQLRLWSADYQSQEVLATMLAPASFVAVAFGRAALGAQIIAAVQMHSPKNPFTQYHTDLAIATVRARLSADDFDEAWARGATFSVRDLIATTEQLLAP